MGCSWRDLSLSVIEMENPPRDYSYLTSCVESTGQLINEMRDDDLRREVTYETMLKHCDLLDWSLEHGYELRTSSGHGLTLKNDWSVSYYKSFYCGVPCYFLVWSAIEYIWIKNGLEHEVRDCEEDVRVSEQQRQRDQRIERRWKSLQAMRYVQPGTGDATGWSDLDRTDQEQGIERPEFQRFRKNPKDRLPGGRADKMGLTPADVDPEQLRMGIEVEFEHVDDRAIAQEIALDHLAEIPDYYTKLKTIDPHDNPGPEPFKDIVIPDSSWYDPDELWGRHLVYGDPACVGANPPPPWIPLVAFSQHRAIEAREILKSYGIKLSSNLKTLLCLSMTRNLSCLMTEWCHKFCYGKSQNFCRPKSVNSLLGNFDAFEFLATAPQQSVDDVAWAIVTLCLAFGIKNIRIPGIGDFTPGLIRVVDAMTADDPGFTVWGFVRKHEMALDEMPVRDNLVIWASIDRSMSDCRIGQALDFAAAHKTGLSYSTELGTSYKPRDGANPQPPWYNPPLHKSQNNQKTDTFLNNFLTNDDMSVVFGYHGRGVTTHVGRDYPECPATDPLGGGHFVATCQECYWCVEKPARRHHGDLIEHRLNTVAVIPIGKHQGTKVLLDTGERV